MGFLNSNRGLLKRLGMLSKEGQHTGGDTSAAGGGGGPGDANAIQTEGGTTIHAEDDSTSVATEAG